MNLQSPFRIGIKPKDGKQYVDELQIGDSKLIVNTSIEYAKDVNRIGVVFSLPFHYKGDLQIGDEVVVHHNVFRITLNDNGVPMQSNYHLKDDLFFVDDNMIYLQIRDGKMIAYGDNVFVEPIIENDYWLGEQIVERQGIVKITNTSLKKIGVIEDTKVVFRKFCENEFNIFGKKYYKMQDKRILAILN